MLCEIPFLDFLSNITYTIVRITGNPSSKKTPIIGWACFAAASLDPKNDSGRRRQHENGCSLFCVYFFSIISSMTQDFGLLILAPQGH